VEESGHGILYIIIPAFAWKTKEKTIMASRYRLQSTTYQMRSKNAKLSTTVFGKMGLCQLSVNTV
jgi:hypothetical protein